MEMSECVKTEDVYQTLHQPPSVKNPNPTHGSLQNSRLITILLIFNSLLLIIILVLIGTFIAKYQNTAEVNGPQASGEDTHKLRDTTVLDEKKEAWLLFDDSLYYLWEAEGNCTEAVKFCRAKGSNIRLAVLTQRNRDWLVSQAEGRRLLVAEDDSLSRCKLVGDPVRLETPFIQGEEQGWVCEQHHRLVGLAAASNASLYQSVPWDASHHSKPEKPKSALKQRQKRPQPDPLNVISTYSSHIKL
ncbi:hypothetical protein MHYP_G00284580 [Metynnis hypsauchen]